MKSNSGNKLKYYLELCKLKIMIPVSLTGFTGYFIFDPRISVKIIIVSFGILLLAISASVLNQIQEVELDRKILSQIAIEDPQAFTQIVKKVI